MPLNLNAPIMTGSGHNRGMETETSAQRRASLPRLIEEIAAIWALKVEPPFPALSWNYAVPATRLGGERVAIKICLPDCDYESEAAALALYDGRGAVRLLALDRDRRAMLLERAEPGESIRSLPDDASTHIAAETMRLLWRPAPPDGPLQRLEGWFDGFAKHRHRFGGSGPIEPNLFDRGERLFAELLASQSAPVVLHGDFHHENLLSSGQVGWIAIDPKGVVGEPAYEPANWLRNPRGIQRRPGLPRILSRRLDQFAEILEIDRIRIRDWGVVQIVLSACWFLEDDDPSWRSDVAIAELLLSL